jgi:hypothetical protein
MTDHETEEVYVFTVQLPEIEFEITATNRDEARSKGIEMAYQSLCFDDVADGVIKISKQTTKENEQ